MSICAKLGREKSCLSECAYTGEERECPLYERPGELKVVYIPVGLIDHHPDNPRKSIRSVEELAASIRNEGIRQPLTIVQHIDGLSGRYTAVIGHRRLEAAKLVGLAEVPAIVAEMTRKEQLTAMMTENGQREDLTPVEQADGFQMILDLPGETVASVAETTGFSETTVRRRLKLRELDWEKLEEANRRGATLADYEKLNAIKSPERRNQVLEHIGTAEFARRLQAAQGEEATEAYLDEVAEKLEKLGCTRISQAEFEVRKGKLQRVKGFYVWDKGEKIEGFAEDAEEICYCYTRGSHSVDLYRDRVSETPKADTTTDKVEQLRKQAQEELETIQMELEDMNQEFRDLREEFVAEFDTFERNREEIIQFAVRGMLWSGGIDKEELAAWVGVDYDDETGMDQMAFDQVLRVCPEKVLLYVAYLKLEDGDRSYNNPRSWDDEMQSYVPVAKRDKQQDLLYDCLKLLGYQQSTDEQRASVGDLPQYGQAQRILADFKAEKKEVGA